VGSNGILVEDYDELLQVVNSYTDEASAVIWAFGLTALGPMFSCVVHVFLFFFIVPLELLDMTSVSNVGLLEGEQDHFDKDCTNLIFSVCRTRQKKSESS
jgi:hypothetical protein